MDVMRLSLSWKGLDVSVNIKSNYHLLILLLWISYGGLVSLSDSKFRVLIFGLSYVYIYIYIFVGQWAVGRRLVCAQQRNCSIYKHCISTSMIFLRCNGAPRTDCSGLRVNTDV